MAARVDIPVKAAPGDAVGVDATASWKDASADNHKVANPSGNTILICKTEAGESCTVTIVSVADPYGRLGDLGPTAVAAEKTFVFGPWSPGLFSQTSADLGYVYVNIGALVLTPQFLAIGW